MVSLNCARVALARKTMLLINSCYLMLQKGAWEYIEKTRDMVHDLEKRVQAAKNNVDSMGQLMTKWCEAPLYERKEGKKEGLLNIEVNNICIFESHFEPRYWKQRAGECLQLHSHP